MRWIVVCVIGCGGSGDPDPDAAPREPPVVTSLVPTTGPYGGDLVITGQHLVSSGSRITAENTTWIYESVGEPSWSDTEIVIQPRFPMAGRITIDNGYGTAEVGVFTPSPAWPSGTGCGLVERLETAVVGGSHVAAVYAKKFAFTGSLSIPTLVVFDGPDAGCYPFDPVPQGHGFRAKIGDDRDGHPVVLATSTDGLVAYRAIAGQLTRTVIGGNATPLGVGHDATGVYAWVSNNGAVRLREGTPWVVETGPVAFPSNLRDTAVAANGTLHLAYSKSVGEWDDYRGVLTLARIVPGATAVSGIETPDPTEYDDEISFASLVIAPDGKRMTVSYRADDSGTEQDLGTLLRSTTGTWTYFDAPLWYAFTPTSIAVATWTDPSTTRGVTLIPDLADPATTIVAPVWPAMPEGLVADATGKPRPIVTLGDMVYAPVTP